MKSLRIVAIVGAILIMAGEAYRSWGAGRPVFAWLDDMIAGAMMISAALLVRRPTVARRAYFAASWGVAVGMLYGSYFSKLHAPSPSDPGNIELRALTVLVGIALLLAIGGLIASILLPDQESPR
jgi:hypothetical protein